MHESVTILFAQIYDTKVEWSLSDVSDVIFLAVSRFLCCAPAVLQYLSLQMGLKFVVESGLPNPVLRFYLIAPWRPN